MMIRLHSLSSNEQPDDEAEVGQTYWLTTDVARQFISILEAGIAKIEATEYQDRDYKKH
jgi:biofilm regulator BssS